MAHPGILQKRILQLIAEILHTEMSDPRIKFASVTKIKLSKDNRYCTVYISILGNPNQQRTVMRGIEHAQGFIQAKLGERLSMRYTPILRFEEDFSIEKSIEISKLIQKAQSDSPQQEEADNTEDTDADQDTDTDDEDTDADQDADDEDDDNEDDDADDEDDDADQDTDDDAEQDADDEDTDADDTRKH